MIIGLNGIDFSNGNLGCSALAYSLISSLNKQCKNKNIKTKYIIFCFKYSENEKNLLCNSLNINLSDIECIEIKLKSIKNINQTIRYMKKCDFIVDMSGGDSFSDIYGLKRMVRECSYKLLAIINKIPLILGPQTYGPYNLKISKILAKIILKKATIVFSRDKKSSELIYELSKINAIDTTDLAFRLPYTKETKFSKKSIGINISALMWNAGFNGKNQFGLKINYKEYINKIIYYIKQLKDNEIYLISHVNGTGIEDDYKLCKELSQKYNVNLAPKFKTPIEAKTFISKLDLLIGSRMHATIGAFSSGVPTISLAYSKKFEGLYKSIDYNYYIDAKKCNTEEAINLTKEYINQSNQMKKSLEISMKNVKEKLDIYDKKISDYIEGIR